MKQRKTLAAAPKRKSSKWQKTWLGRKCKQWFSPRSIIIVSEHKTEHVPLSIRRQLIWTFALIVTVAGSSYFAGNYMAIQRSLAEKERLIANSHLKNRRIESEFALLKRDLVNMLESEESSELGEYAQFVIKQYRENGHSLDEIEVDLSKISGGKHGAVFERIAFLEQTVEQMKADHEMIMAAVEETAHGKLGELEQIIKLTGLDIRKLERNSETYVEEKLANEQQSEKDNPRGGPYDPVNERLLKRYNRNLFENIKRLVVLDELVKYMPLAIPMDDYRITSGFGPRKDPIRKHLANHYGLDFAGPYAARIRSASDGIVKHAGRKGAYGNLVIIDHGFDFTTRYGHMKKVLVKKGQKVKAGDVIGVQGSTGRSTGAHLHYEVRYKGDPLNPEKFIKAGKHVQKVAKKK